jgi:hypothetical protein
VNTVSFVQGPPGTGKTYNASVILLSLSLLEKGKIMVCAPSNEASDCITESIAKLNRRFDLRRNILRVLARSREEQRLISTEDGGEYIHCILMLPFSYLLYLLLVYKNCFSIRCLVGMEPTYAFLHQEVRKSPKWMLKDGIAGILESKFVR